LASRAWIVDGDLFKKRYAHVIRQTNDGKHMDIQYSDQQIDIPDKYLTTLDRFVLDFIRILEQKTSYVIVRGYVAILFGRSRGTEDVDILIPPVEKDTFEQMHRALLEGEYEFLNAENASGLYDMLTNALRIRIAKKRSVYPEH